MGGTPKTRRSYVMVEGGEGEGKMCFACVTGALLVSFFGGNFVFLLFFFFFVLIGYIPH